MPLPAAVGRATPGWPAVPGSIVRPARGILRRGCGPAACPTGPRIKAAPAVDPTQPGRRRSGAGHPDASGAPGRCPTGPSQERHAGPLHGRRASSGQGGRRRRRTAPPAARRARSPRGMRGGRLPGSAATARSADRATPPRVPPRRAPHRQQTGPPAENRNRVRKNGASASRRRPRGRVTRKDALGMSRQPRPGPDAADMRGRTAG